MSKIPFGKLWYSFLQLFALRSIQARLIIGISAVGLTLLLFVFILVSRLGNVIGLSNSLSSSYQPVKIYAFATMQGLNQLVSSLQSNVYTLDQRVPVNVNKELRLLWKEKTRPYYDSLSQVVSSRNEPEVLVVYEAIKERVEQLDKLIPSAIEQNKEENKKELFGVGAFGYDDSNSDDYMLKSNKAVIAYNENLAFILENDIIRLQSELNSYFAQLVAFNDKATRQSLERLENEYANFGFWEVMAFLATTILLVLITVLLIRYILKDIRQVLIQARTLSEGDIPKAVYTSSKELNSITIALNTLAKNLNLIRRIANNISIGVFDKTVVPFEGRGDFGKAILLMGEGLQKISDEERLRSWRNEGIAKFGEILRRESSNIELLCDQVVSELVRYIGANQAGIFVLNEEGGQPESHFMELKACYAYDKKKFLEKKMLKGQGLIGRAWKEGLPIYMTDIPTSYIEIRTGLGGASPRYLYIIPLKSNEEVEGVLEIASFHDILPHHKEFVGQLAQSIASTLTNTKSNRKTQILLDNSLRISAQMRQKEEELRQNVEELQATQEEMQRAQREVAEKEGNMRALLDNTSDAVMAFNHQYRILVINKAMKRLYESMGVYLEIGAKVEDAFPGRTLELMQEEFVRALSGERFTEYASVSLKGETFYYEILYNPIYNERQRVMGASVFVKDVTHQKSIENSLKVKEANLNSLINNTEDSIVAIDKNYRLIVFNEVYLKRRRHLDFKEGDDALMLIPEAIREEWRGYYDRALKGERFDKIIKRQEGKKINYRQYSFNPILDEQEKVIGLSVFSKDITEAKQAEAENYKIIQNLFEQQRKDKEVIKELQRAISDLQSTTS